MMWQITPAMMDASSDMIVSIVRTSSLLPEWAQQRRNCNTFLENEKVAYQNMQESDIGRIINLEHITYEDNARLNNEDKAWGILLRRCI